MPPPPYDHGAPSISRLRYLSPPCNRAQICPACNAVPRPRRCQQAPRGLLGITTIINVRARRAGCVRDTLREGVEAEGLLGRRG
ncbi:hypothetical protein GALMADRAFT_1073112 [Galerina marginata CBS 339.88]|uniref:Uncharacterized protein n=1 Tax=Galerina marginata (strain CBS 339.88) TaxID=685588 RepID=A0A067SA18_GALM3|nr:hypothetical protein GALMADRAFT_1073112 [Galerina marginata CBS 339.88]